MISKQKNKKCVKYDMPFILKWGVCVDAQIREHTQEPDKELSLGWAVRVQSGGAGTGISLSLYAVFNCFDLIL